MDSKTSKDEPKRASRLDLETSSCNPFEPAPDDVSLGSQITTRPIPDRGHGQVGEDTATMDPFEVRIRFTQHLQHLNASVTSANKAAQYALKYRDMDEDLHSCILEQLERVCVLTVLFLLDYSLLRGTY